MPLTQQSLAALGLDKQMPTVMDELRQSGLGEPLPGLRISKALAARPAGALRGN